MILTTAQYREHRTTALEDDALQRLLDAAEAEIVRYADDPDTASELVAGGGPFLVLARPAESITSITEQGRWSSVVTTLAADDYLLHPGGLRLERLTTGTDPRSTWADRVSLSYVPVSDDDIRVGVQLDLVTLMESYAPGITSEQIGAWAETRAANAVWNSDSERSSILGRLDIGPSIVVVGPHRRTW